MGKKNIGLEWFLSIFEMCFLFNCIIIQHFSQQLFLMEEEHNNEPQLNLMGWNISLMLNSFFAVSTNTLIWEVIDRLKSVFLTARWTNVSINNTLLISV